MVSNRENQRRIEVHVTVMVPVLHIWLGKGDHARFGLQFLDLTKDSVRKNAGSKIAKVETLKEASRHIHVTNIISCQFLLPSLPLAQDSNLQQAVKTTVLVSSRLVMFGVLSEKKKEANYAWV
nr:hypothetical protein Iba_chr03bCG15200 [Ipomoea batatas]